MMKRMFFMQARKSILFVFIGLFLFGLNSWAANHKANVILILADDMAIGDIAKFNGGITRTPNLDRLIKDGLWFANAYSGSAVCAPSRAALLTGRYPHRTGVVTLNMVEYPELTRLHKDETTIAQVFTANGYQTGLIGKWHTGLGEGYGPISRGFREFEGFHGSDKTTYFKYAIQTDDSMDKEAVQTEKYLTDELTDRALAFVKRHAKEPFFMHLAYYSPHRPLQAPESAVEPYLKAGFVKEVATIYAMIEIMDRGIGELRDELVRQGIAENTLIIFASDNGPDSLVPKRFNLGLRGTKYEVHEGGIHVPLIMAWPRHVTAGSRVETVHFTDILPTLVEVCGLKFTPTKKLDGVSIASLLKSSGKAETPHRFWQWNRGVPNYTHNAALRDGDWKLVRPFITKNLIKGDAPDAAELYRLSADSGETYDLSKQFPDRFESMKKELDILCREVEQERLRSE